MSECYLKIGKENYNVTKFLKNHPGGYNYLEAYKDKNVQNRMRDTFHSKAAFYLLRDYKVGGRNDGVVEGQKDLEYLINWNEPIFTQIGKLGENYPEWISLPVDQQVRFFGNPILESLTIASWYLVPIFWTPFILYFFYAGALKLLAQQVDQEISAANVMLIMFVFSSGLLLWTFLEYSLHRWLFHIKPNGNSILVIYFHFIIHGYHHKVPFDPQRLVFPPLASFALGLSLYLIAFNIVPYHMLDLATAGVLTGYVTYEMVHYYLHHGSPEENTYMYTLKRSHNQHHYSQIEKAYGVSSNYWDKIFGTTIKLRKLAFSIKW